MSKNVIIPYGKQKLLFKVPENVDCQEIRSIFQEPETDGKDIVREALENPIGSPSLKELTKYVKSIVIITNDNTRPMPSKITLPEMIKHFFYQERYYDITIVIATGLHRQMTDQEMYDQYGEEFCKSHKVICHDAKDKERNVFIKKLSTGNNLYIEKVAAECDLLISEGFIEPHFFAGFSGGRKSVLPGISAAETIMYNHSPTNIGHEKARQANLVGNPIHVECEEAAKAANLRFILNVTLNEKKEIIAAFAGDPIEAHNVGCKYVKGTMSVSAKKTDIVITSNNGYPLDRNLYQTVKGIDTAAKVVKKDGVIIVASQCKDGIGHDSFSNLIKECQTIDELDKKMSNPPFAIDKWQVQILAKALNKATIILVNDVITKEELKELFFEFAPNLENAYKLAREKMGEGASLSILADGPVVIPIVDEE